MAIFDTSPWPYVDNDLSIPVRHAQFDLNGASQQMFTTPAILFGFAVANASGSATAELDIYDATGTGGAPLFPITLAANESTREWFGERGLLMHSGIFLNVSSGEVKGSVFFVPMSGSSAGS